MSPGRLVTLREAEMKKRLVILGAVIAVASAVLLFTLFRNGRNDGALLLFGNVEVTEVNLGFKMPGRIAVLAVEEGRRVRKGDRLAALDSAELESFVAQNRSTVSLAEAELEKAKKDHDRYSTLMESGAISVQQMDAAKRAYDAATSQLRQTKAALAASEERLRDADLQFPWLLRATMRSPLRSPAQVEGTQGFLPQPGKDLERPSSTRLEARFPSHGSRAMTWVQAEHQPLDDRPGQGVHERLERHLPARELLRDHGQRGAGRLADAERQVARLAPHG